MAKCRIRLLGARNCQHLPAMTISIEVIDLRGVLPIDTHAVLRSVAKTRRAVIVHATTRFAGPAAEISSIINEELFGELRAPVKRVGAAFAPSAISSLLVAAHTPNSASVEAAVRGVIR